MSKIMTPSGTVSELNKHIVGQHRTKKAVAVALRNRWRHQQVGDPPRQETTPKGILMIGPTDVSKTEIARRLTKLADAPFIKTEVAKFTEVDYAGRNVDTIVYDLVEMVVKQMRGFEMKKVHAKTKDAIEDRIFDALVLPPRDISFVQPEEKDSTARQTFRKELREGQPDDKEIELEVSTGAPSVDIMGPPGVEDMAERVCSMFAGLGQSKENRRKMKVSETFRLLIDEEVAKLVNGGELKQKAVINVEQNGIVFLDKTDEIASHDEYGGGEVSRQGVQRGLLPLTEGTTINAKCGIVKADRILPIASGAFHLLKSSDLIPGLQDRFPVHVELDLLSVEDFRAILTQTDANFTKRYQALLKAEGVDLAFAEDGICRLAEIACSVSEKVENIDTRHLYTVIGRLLEDLSFHAHKSSDETVTVDTAYADGRLSELSGSEDLSRYML